jgi:hypothetical protein
MKQVLRMYSTCSSCALYMSFACGSGGIATVWCGFSCLHCGDGSFLYDGFFCYTASNRGYGTAMVHIYPHIYDFLLLVLLWVLVYRRSTRCICVLPLVQLAIDCPAV